MSSNGILDQKTVLREDQMVAGVWGVILPDRFSSIRNELGTAVPARKRPKNATIALSSPFV